MHVLEDVVLRLGRNTQALAVQREDVHVQPVVPTATAAPLAAHRGENEDRYPVVGPHFEALVSEVLGLKPKRRAPFPIRGIEKMTRGAF